MVLFLLKLRELAFNSNYTVCTWNNSKMIEARAWCWLKFTAPNLISQSQADFLVLQLHPQLLSTVTAIPHSQRIQISSWVKDLTSSSQFVLHRLPWNPTKFRWEAFPPHPHSRTQNGTALSPRGSSTEAFDSVACYSSANSMRKIVVLQLKAVSSIRFTDKLQLS